MAEVIEFAKNISIWEAGKDEYWLQDQIYENSNYYLPQTSVTAVTLCDITPRILSIYWHNKHNNLWMIHEY
jgi:hypothetical protein